MKRCRSTESQCAGVELFGRDAQPEMRSLKEVWTYDNFNDFIANPTESVPSTIKCYFVQDLKQRTAIIA